MNTKELLQKQDIKNYLDKFFNRVNLRKLSKTFPDILIEFDQLFCWQELEHFPLSGNTYPKLNDYLGIMTINTLKAIIYYQSKNEVVNQIWFANIKSKNSMVSYLVKILNLASNRLARNIDPFNAALVALAIILTLNEQTEKFKLLFWTTKDLDSDFDEIIFRVQQSMNALAPLKKMYEKWYEKNLPSLIEYINNLNDNNSIYLNASLNVGKITGNCDLLFGDKMINFVYTDQTQLPSEWINEHLINFSLWNFKNGNHVINDLITINPKYNIVYLLKTEELSVWLKKYFSISFHDIIKKLTTMINANKN